MKTQPMVHQQPAANNQQLPCHVAIIMDGNGRWAKAKGLPRIAGHKKGAESLRRALDAHAQKVRELEARLHALGAMGGEKQ